MGVLIIGIGNPLFHDDGFGIEIIRSLSNKYIFPPDVRLIESGSMSSIIDFMDDVGHIIVMDTIVTGKEPGTMYCFNFNEISLPSYVLSHSGGFLETLKNMEDRPEIFFICIEPHNLSLGTGLSPVLNNLLPKVEIEILKRLKSIGIEPNKVSA
jgi:hydrogenase maturation protease